MGAIVCMVCWGSVIGLTAASLITYLVLRVSNLLEVGR